MPIRRTHAEHGDACRMAASLDAIGDQWSLVIVRELLLGPKRFSDLQAAARGITPAVLTSRLRELQGHGVIAPASGREPYRLTPWGERLEDVVIALGRWYSSAPDPTTTGEMTPDGLVLALRTMAPPVPDAGVATVEIIAHPAAEDRIPARHAMITPGVERLEVLVVEGADGGSDELPAATTVLEGPATLLAGVLFGQVDRRSLPAGAVRVEGDHEGLDAVIGRYSAVMVHSEAS